MAESKVSTGAVVGGLALVAAAGAAFYWRDKIFGKATPSEPSPKANDTTNAHPASAPPAGAPSPPPPTAGRTGAPLAVGSTRQARTHYAPGATVTTIMSGQAADWTIGPDGVTMTLAAPLRPATDADKAKAKADLPTGGRPGAGAQRPGTARAAASPSASGAPLALPPASGGAAGQVAGTAAQVLGSAGKLLGGSGGGSPLSALASAIGSGGGDAGGSAASAASSAADALGDAAGNL